MGDVINFPARETWLRKSLDEEQPEHRPNLGARRARTETTLHLTELVDKSVKWPEFD